MKKNLTILAIAIVGLIAFAGCKKSSSGTSYSIKATINGTSFSGVNCVAVSNSGFVVIDGYSGSSATSTSLPIIELTLTGYNNTTGTFNIDGVTNNAIIDSSLTSVPSATSGTITITTATSSEIVGTFNFTCSDGTKVTNGTFTAKGY